MATTDQDLMDAFAGESQANRKYLAWAEQADKEGFPQVAKLFRAVAEAETIHALNHLRTAGGVKSTRENLEAAIAGETYEFSEMYPPMIETAEAEGNNRAKRSFRFANEVEKVHAELYGKALESLDAPESDADYHVCRICGHTVLGDPPEKCPVCGAVPEKYKKVA